MIVFLAGMPRSGSTFAFNIARETLAARGRVYQKDSADIVAALAQADGAAHILLKAHEADPVCRGLVQQSAIITICTVRRVEDAVASWIDAFGFNEADAIETMRKWLDLYRHIRPFALTVPYDLIDTHPFRAAWKIARHISRDAGPLEIWRAVSKNRKATVKAIADRMDRTNPDMVDLGYSFYDSNTYFHRRHVSALKSLPAEQRLAPDRLQRIQDALSTEMRLAGFDSP